MAGDNECGEAEFKPGVDSDRGFCGIAVGGAIPPTSGLAVEEEEGEEEDESRWLILLLVEAGTVAGPADPVQVEERPNPALLGLSCINTGGGNMVSPGGLLPVPEGPPMPVTIDWSFPGTWDSLLWPACISSLVKRSSSSPRSCRYTQSGLLQGTPRMKLLQYFVVPKDALSTYPSSQ
jgi:hypothetical protein